MNDSDAVTPKRGNETVLVAEDDPSLRRLAETVLMQFGYNVIVAEDGDEAIEKFMANSSAIDIAIIDMIMPGKNGKEVYDAIMAVKPSQKTLFASGYTSDILNKEDIKEGMNFIMKPLSPFDLLNKVREILDRR